MNTEEKPMVFPQFEEFTGRQFELPAFGSIGCGCTHDPNRPDDRDKNGSSGGEVYCDAAPADGTLPGRLQPVYELLERAMVEVYKGHIPASRGTALAAIARACVSVLAAGEIEERVRDLESRMGGPKT